MSEISSMDIINLVLIGIITLLSVIVFIMFLTFFIKKKDPHKMLKEINDKITEKSDIKEPEDIGLSPTSFKSKDKKIKKVMEDNTPEDTELIPGHEILDIDRIYDDMLIGDKGTDICSMVIECKGINYSLMSDSEKFEIEKTFVNFINTIEIPIQIYIQTRTLSYQDSANSFEKKQKETEENLHHLLEKLNNIETESNIDASNLNTTLLQVKNKQKIYEYIKFLRSQMSSIKRNYSILHNNYYIIVNFFSYTSPKKINTKNAETLSSIRTDLTEKCEYIIKEIKKCGVEASILNSYQLGELLCSSFLCEQENLYKVNDVLKAGFFKVYSKTRI